MRNSLPARSSFAFAPLRGLLSAATVLGRLATRVCRLLVLPEQRCFRALSCCYARGILVSMYCHTYILFWLGTPGSMLWQLLARG